MPRIVIGVDVAKDWIDVHDHKGHDRRIEMRPGPLGRFARAAASAGAFVVLEATGGYDRPLCTALATAGVAHARVNPARARQFARATGRLAKTDRVDARLLAEMGRRLDLAPAAPVPPARRALQALVARRRQLADMRKQERTRLHQAADAFARRSIVRLLRGLDREIAACEAEIARQVADPAFAEAERRLRTAPGVGPVVATTLIAELPELGTLDRRRIAALAGLAPIARDSGAKHRPRAIGGGRPAPRSMLYIAALQASIHDPAFRACRERLRAAGKSVKQCLVAVARKLLVTLNAMLKAGTDYRSAPG